LIRVDRSWVGMVGVDYCLLGLVVLFGVEWSRLGGLRCFGLVGVGVGWSWFGWVGLVEVGSLSKQYSMIR